MVQYRFRLVGVPPDQAMKLVEIDPNLMVAEVKKSIQHTYKLNQILAIHLLYRGKVIPDNIRFDRLGIHPKKDVVTVMAAQAGGRKKN